MEFLERIEMPLWLSLSIVGLVIVLFVWWKFRDAILFPFQKEETSGVIRNWMAMNEGGKRFFYPLIEYTTKEGRTIKFRAEERCEGEPLYSPGTEVTVYYSKKDPSKVRVHYPRA